jgi:hypothetical protein
MDEQPLINVIDELAHLATEKSAVLGSQIAR